MLGKEEVKRIKEAIDIVELAGHYTELRHRGRALWGRCPFHQEKTPSFKVDSEKRVGHRDAAL